MYHLLERKSKDWFERNVEVVFPAVGSVAERTGSDGEDCREILVRGRR